MSRVIRLETEEARRLRRTLPSSVISEEVHQNLEDEKNSSEFFDLPDRGWGS